MRRHRKMMFAGAGSAIAATIVIVASLLISTPGVTVEAATIFASLREAMGNAFTISLENIGDDEGTINGKLVILYNTESEGSEDDSGSIEQSTEDVEYVSGAYFQIDVQVAQDAPEMAGLVYARAGLHTGTCPVHCPCNAFPVARGRIWPDICSFKIQNHEACSTGWAVNNRADSHRYHNHPTSDSRYDQAQRLL